jgi:hypothetical protein
MKCIANAAPHIDSELRRIKVDSVTGRTASTRPAGDPLTG